MKNCYRFLILYVLFLIIGGTRVSAQDNTLLGKVICGYQGWFNCYGDGSPVERWVHWSGGKYRTNEGLPAPGHLNFELYPEVEEYAPGSLFQTGFANQGDGKPSVLFSSTKKDVINKHFEWMQKYGIDGVALQRFLSTDGVFVKQKDTVAINMRTAAEKYGRIFYMMYDMSASDSAVFRKDLIHIETFGLTSSPNYARQNGKPVICIWGFGFNHRANLPAKSLEIVNWLKAKGYYVVGGVPTHWRTATGDSFAGYQAVYEAFDMLSPWAVGRFSDLNGADNYHNTVTLPDKAFCDSHNIAYQPVIFSGFAWSNWNGGTKNMIPRNRGEFFWRQFKNIKNSNIKNLYVAMFDEYDEGTAILKAADSYYSVPTNQYFLTTSADGTYISSDFYMRLVGKATRVLQDKDPLTTNVPIPYSEGPIYFRTSFESGYDAIPNWTNTTIDSKGVGGTAGWAAPRCFSTTSEQFHIGNYALRFSGADNSATESYCSFQVFDVDIPVATQTKMTYWFRPADENGRYTAVDLLMTDGTRLNDLDAKDVLNNSMKASAGHGTVNQWNKTTCNIGQWLNGKTIDKILVRFDHPAATGEFNGYFDDFFIYNEANFTDSRNPVRTTESGMAIYPNPVTGKELYLDLRSSLSDENLVLKITDLTGRVCLQKNIQAGDRKVQLDGLKSGIYLVSVKGKVFSETRKITVR